MHYQKELQFLLNFFNNHKINTCFNPKKSDIYGLDFNIKQILNYEQGYTQMIDFVSKLNNSNTIFKIIDQFYCVYYCMLLPNKTSKIPFVIGPYLQTHPHPELLYQYVDQYSVSPSTFQNLWEAFSKIPVVMDDTSIQTIIQTFGETVWNGKTNFEYQIMNHNLEESLYTTIPANSSYEIHNQFDTQLLETYLAQENALIQAVNHGQTQVAEDLISSIGIYTLSETSPEMLRNMKNFAITLNALLRKSLELNSINSQQIISIASKFGHKIELSSSPEALYTLLRQMVRKYSLLIKNHTMKEYSPLIQQAIKQIDIDLTADLSLHTMAKKLNSNASYLSTQFKKVTGSTYTEYVQHKRIEHSLFLLNTTSLQIQTIAQYCGIPDLNYFSKLFKKYVKLSPTAYRKELTKHGP